MGHRVRRTGRRQWLAAARGAIARTGPCRTATDAARATHRAVQRQPAQHGSARPCGAARHAPLRSLTDWWHGRTSTATLTPDQTRQQAVHAIAGIAHPQRFFDALARQGFAIEGIALDDHADFATLPWPASARNVIMTEKDAVKLPPGRIAAERPDCRAWVAALDFRPEDSFWAAVDAALALLPAPATTDQRGTPHQAPPTP
ncbi:MAG: tetraacyldisaccharide 4'-kinase [Aquabacterium sp.]